MPNYFDFFGFPLSFVLDEAALRRAFLQNSKKYHPDYHTLADEAQQTAMLEQSTLNNEAYKTLSDLDSRIRYVLRLKGLIGDEGKADVLPQDFLMEMMDINEQIMELEFDPDPQRLQESIKAIQKLENELFVDIQPILQQYDDTTSAPEQLQAVKLFFLKKRYLLRILENVRKFAPA